MFTGQRGGSGFVQMAALPPGGGAAAGTAGAVVVPTNSFYNYFKPNYIVRIVIVLALHGFTIFAITKNSHWWDTNTGFKNKPWIFPTTTILIMLTAFVAVYIWLWYTCLTQTRLRTDLYFVLALTFIFICLISIFIDKDPDVSLPFGVFALMVMVHLTDFIHFYCGYFYAFISLFLWVFTLHLIAQIYCVQ
jgi:hypothetical protein